MEKLYRILETVDTPICVPLGGEGKLFRCQELVHRTSRGEGSGGDREAQRQGGCDGERDIANTSSTMDSGSAPHCSTSEEKLTSLWLSQALLLGWSQMKVMALQTGLPEAGQETELPVWPSLPEAACTLQVSLSAWDGLLLAPKLLHLKAEVRINWQGRGSFWKPSLKGLA